jgi:hypothetical protein
MIVLAGRTSSTIFSPGVWWSYNRERLLAKAHQHMTILRSALQRFQLVKHSNRDFWLSTCLQMLGWGFEINETLTFNVKRFIAAMLHSKPEVNGLLKEGLDHANSKYKRSVQMQGQLCPQWKSTSAVSITMLSLCFFSRSLKLETTCNNWGVVLNHLPKASPTIDIDTSLNSHYDITSTLSAQDELEVIRTKVPPSWHQLYNKYYNLLAILVAKSWIYIEHAHNSLVHWWTWKSDVMLLQLMNPLKV